MSLWGSKANSGIKPAPPKIRIEKIPVATKPSSASSSNSKTTPAKPAPAKGSPAASRAPSRASVSATPPPATTSRDSVRLRPTKQKSFLRHKSPVHQRIESDSEDDGSSTSFDDFSSKRQRRVHRPVDLKRRLRSRISFSENQSGFKFVHAADVSSEDKRPKAVASKYVTVELQYPSISPRERYDLIFGKDKIDPPHEIFDIAKIVAEVYLTPGQAEPFTDPNTGIIRKLDRAKNMLSRDTKNIELQQGFKDAVEIYNSALDQLIREGSLAKNLDTMHDLPFDMVCCILRQVYDRAVSPQVDLLKQYENGTDNIYGELLPPFVSKILGETHLKSDQIFVDLGSGVGNVVLQAALEFGCESWGCEMMENACRLAEAQETEFAARCRLWGIRTGAVRLERGDFLENDPIKEVMKKADVILVNNQAFTPQLNRRLIDLFLDLKNGCKIISLRSFVPHDHKISARNRDDPINVLDVVRGEYYDKSVSWTDVGGEYFVATKDDRRLKDLDARA
ncbi:histone-lysine N-methyltransferase, H3 lysine-79 specific [Xylogone sp. PMI_703]|nr:histone-lysine N-methyltransferase, H3 lysine-79 specific [Xylogone sp. PMI_703]